MRDFSGMACSAVRIQPWRDGRERWRQHIVPAGLSGAAVDLACGASVKMPTCHPKRARGRRLEQCPPTCARATRGIELRQAGGRARGTGWTEQRIGSGARCHSKQETCSEVAKRGHWRGLTFDMSGGAKGAKRPLRRPLDGGVRPQSACELTQRNKSFLPCTRCAGPRPRTCGLGQLRQSTG